MELEKLIISENATIIDGLILISENSYGICFIVDKSKKILGTLSDGDIRRHLIKGRGTKENICTAMNRDFVSLPVNTKSEIIRAKYSSELKFIPLLDSSGKVVDVVNAKENHRISILEPCFTNNETIYLMDCIKSGWVSSNGKYVRRFEEEFSKWHDNAYTIATSSGTSALHLCLTTLGITEGDDVLVPDLTFAATVNSVLYCNATPVLVDIDEEKWCINLQGIKKARTEKTRAIIVVHLYGQMPNMQEIQDYCEEEDLLLIEDCAESIGSKYMNKKSGLFGHAAAFSFFGNKTITTGEGGMAIFKSKKASQLAKKLRDHGMDTEKRYWHDVVGYNYRMTNMQAALGVAQIEQLSNIIEKKLAIMDAYNKLLKGKCYVKKLPFAAPNVIHSNWLYTIMIDIESIDILSTNMLSKGVEIRRVFYPLHLMPPYQSYGNAENMQNSIKLAKYGISLPSSASLSLNQLSYIVENLDECLS